MIAPPAAPPAETPPRPRRPRQIPPLIHQTWRTDQVPGGLEPYQRSWWTHNPSYKYRFWTDAEALRFVAECYPSFLAVYQGYRLPIMRADAARYLWMHSFGGVYADLDYECLGPVDELLGDHHVVLGLEPVEHVDPGTRDQGIRRIVGNAFLASAPGHPFWAHVIDQLVLRRGEPDPLRATGPLFLTKALAQFSGCREVTMFESRVLYPATKEECWRAQQQERPLRPPRPAVGVHHWVGTWWRSGVLERLESTRSVPSSATSLTKSVLRPRRFRT